MRFPVTACLGERSTDRYGNAGTSCLASVVFWPCAYHRGSFSDTPSEAPTSYTRPHGAFGQFPALRPNRSVLKCSLVFCLASETANLFPAPPPPAGAGHLGLNIRPMGGKLQWVIATDPPDRPGRMPTPCNQGCFPRSRGRSFTPSRGCPSLVRQISRGELPRPRRGKRGWPLPLAHPCLTDNRSAAARIWPSSRSACAAAGAAPP